MHNFEVTYSVKETGRNAPKWDLDLDLDGKVTYEDFQERIRLGHIKIARQALKEEIDKGFDKDYRNRTDNVLDRSDLKVKAFGKIEYYARVAPTVLIREVYNQILKYSVRSTGYYVRNHKVYLNNQLIASSYTELDIFLKTRGNNFKERDVLRFINTTPYSRKLERKGIRAGVRGKTLGLTIKKIRKGTSKVTGKPIGKPNGAYHFAYSWAKRTNKGAVKRLYYNLMPNGSYGIKIPTVRANGQVMRTTYSSGGKYAKASAGRPYLYPSIVLRFSDKGITKGNESV